MAVIPCPAPSSLWRGSRWCTVALAPVQSRILCLVLNSRDQQSLVVFLHIPQANTRAWARVNECVGMYLGTRTAHSSFSFPHPSSGLPRIAKLPQQKLANRYRKVLCFPTPAHLPLLHMCASLRLQPPAGLRALLHRPVRVGTARYPPGAVVPGYRRRRGHAPA